MRIVVTAFVLALASVPSWGQTLNAPVTIVDPLNQAQFPRAGQLNINSGTAGQVEGYAELNLVPFDTQTSNLGEVIIGAQRATVGTQDTNLIFQAINLAGQLVTLGTWNPETGLSVGALTINGVAPVGASIFASPPVLGSTTPNVVDATTVNATTVNAGGITATNLSAAGTINVTGTITPGQTTGIVGTNTTNNAQGGSVGEFMTISVPLGSAVVLTSTTSANVASLALTAGDWDIWGEAWFTFGGTTTTTYLQASVNFSSATIASGPGALMSTTFRNLVGTGPGQEILTVNPCRVTIASTTSYFLVVNATFGVSTASAYGRLFARRVR